MELRKKFQMPGRHPGCKKCPNLGTENCKCKDNLPSSCSSAQTAAQPAAANSDLVAEVTKKVLAALGK